MTSELTNQALVWANINATINVLQYAVAMYPQNSSRILAAINQLRIVSNEVMRAMMRTMTTNEAVEVTEEG